MCKRFLQGVEKCQYYLVLKIGFARCELQDLYEPQSTQYKLVFQNLLKAKLDLDDKAILNFTVQLKLTKT